MIGRGPVRTCSSRERCTELTGQVPGVVFPSGMIVDDFEPDGFARDDSPVRVYYGAADTSVCLATGTIKGLLAALDDE